MTQNEQLELMIEFFKKNDHELSEGHYRARKDKPVSIKLLKRMWGSGNAYLRARRRAIEEIAKRVVVSKPVPKAVAPATPKPGMLNKPAPKAAPKPAPKAKVEKGTKKA
jgi:hypothetical protein